ncbi:hypothetical protein BD779DRAFT_1568345, partial [Infundibulicybe gibba]
MAALCMLVRSNNSAFRSSRSSIIACISGTFVGARFSAMSSGGGSANPADGTGGSARARQERQKQFGHGIVFAEWVFGKNEDIGNGNWKEPSPDKFRSKRAHNKMQISAWVHPQPAGNEMISDPRAYSECGELLRSEELGEISSPTLCLKPSGL